MNIKILINLIRFYDNYTIIAFPLYTIIIGIGKKEELERKKKVNILI